jgi:hypothetical protein
MVAPLIVDATVAVMVTPWLTDKLGGDNVTDVAVVVGLTI